MISLGIAEMVARLVQVCFGAGGIVTDRVVGDPVLGELRAADRVYYLIAGWCLLCMIAMYALTQTPLGRMANAVRDNAERVRFIGYDPTRVRYRMFCLASFFAGIAGGLATINYEIVTAETLGLMASGNVLFMAFVGGIGHFFGPVIGAVLVSYLQSALSTYTQAWLLYFGLFFVIMILFAPGGIASLFAVHGAPLRHGLLSRLIPGYLLCGAMLVVMLLGFIALVEMLYHFEQGAALGREFNLFGFHVDVTLLKPWLVAGAVFAVGLTSFLFTLPVVKGHGRRSTSSCRRGTSTILELRQCTSASGAHQYQRRGSRRRQERAMVIGPNGAGKSTLFNLISGRFPSLPVKSCSMDRTSPTPRRTPSTAVACRAASDPNIFPKLRLRTCAVRCCGRWATAILLASLGSLAQVQARAGHRSALPGAPRPRG